MVEVEPQPQHWLSATRLDEVAGAFAYVADLKAPFLRGRSGSVAELAEATARNLGFAAADVAALRRAALLHDLGRVGVANGVWEKPGPLSVGGREQVRLHPYHAERILSCSSLLVVSASCRSKGSQSSNLLNFGPHR